MAEKGDLFYGGPNGMNDLASHATLPSDSSPFREKYEIDEDGELLGEVSYSPSHLNYIIITKHFKSLNFNLPLQKIQISKVKISSIFIYKILSFLVLSYSIKKYYIIFKEKDINLFINLSLKF